MQSFSHGLSVWGLGLGQVTWRLRVWELKAEYGMVERIGLTLWDLQE